MTPLERVAPLELRPASWLLAQGRERDAALLMPLLVILGTIFGLGLLNVILAGALREPVGLWYAGAMLAFALYDVVQSGAAWRWLWPQLTVPYDPLAAATFLVYLALVIAFARTLLDLPRVAPLLWRAVLGGYAIVVLVKLAYVVFPSALDRIGLYDALDPLVTTGFLFVVFLAGVVAWQRGNPLARWSSIAFAGVVMGFAITLSGTYGAIARTPLTDAAAGTGVAWEAIFLSVALAYRIRGLSERATLHDALTGIANRRAFELRFDEEWRRATRTRTPIALAILDVDSFKAYNDACGHPQGDRVLLRVARALAKTLRRPEDFVGRYGGEEFVVLLPGCAREDAARITDSLRAAVRGLGISHPTSDHGVVTISAGVASLIPRDAVRPISLIAAADRALYAAKRDGRDRIRLARFGSRAYVN